MPKASKEPLVSVIVPVYNVEKYLRRCLDSIIDQTYKNLEIILVDDGSTDDSEKICDEYRKQDSRIKVIRQKNAGLSAARNNGIDISTGSFITFIDSDDYVEVSFVDLTKKSILKTKSDIAICAHKTIYPSRIINPENKQIRTFTKESVIEKMLYQDPIIGVSAWAKVFKKELFEGVRFPEGKLFEDTATTYRLYDKANRIITIGYSSYNYMMNKDNITHKRFTKEKLDLIAHTKEMTNYISAKYPQLEKGCHCRLAWAYLSTIAQASKEKKYRIANDLISKLSRIRLKVITDSKAPRNEKIGLLSTILGAKMYGICWSIYSRR